MSEEENTEEFVKGEPISNEDEVVAMCADCCSVIPDRIAEKDIFLQAGKNGVCKFCGGPVIVTYQSQVQKLRDRRANGEMLA